MKFKEGHLDWDSLTEKERQFLEDNPHIKEYFKKKRYPYRLQDYLKLMKEGFINLVYVLFAMFVGFYIPLLIIGEIAGCCRK